MLKWSPRKLNFISNLRAKRAGYAEILEWDKISVDEFYNSVISMLQVGNIIQTVTFCSS